MSKRGTRKKSALEFALTALVVLLLIYIAATAIPQLIEEKLVASLQPPLGAGESIAYYDAGFVSQIVPETMEAGKTYSVSVMMENTGAATWTNRGNFKLGSQNPQDNTEWGLSRVLLSSTDSIATGQRKKFTFTVKAPTTPGTYDFQWRMLKEGLKWFGQYSQNVAVEVTSGNIAPTGVHDSSSCEKSIGWACDQNDYSSPLSIRFYADGDETTGTFLGDATADKEREEAVAAYCGGNAYHGFEFLTPDSLKDGNDHTIYAYAINTPAGANKLLDGQQRSINCGTGGFTVSITSPYEGQYVSGTSYTLVNAHTSDIGNTRNVEFYVDGNLAFNDFFEPFTLYWNTATLPNGLHSVKAKAHSKDGQSAEKTISVDVLNVGVTLVGQPAIVFDYSSQKCDAYDIPDLGARAFRDVNGKVQLIATHINNRRMKGGSLENVKKLCPIVMKSHEDETFLNFNYAEWLAAPYTFDGKKIYSLIHEEWHAHLVDPKCNKDPNGWISAITMAVSTDAGASYTHPADYKVRHPTQPWLTSFPCSPTDYTRYGSFTPSNIVKKEEYYYFLTLNIRPPNHPETPKAAGLCLLRTKTINDASSWEFYAKNGFVKSKTADCDFVAPALPAHSLTYNQYLNAFVLTAYWNTPKQFVFALSKDLIHWSNYQSILPVPDLSNGNPQLHYPSLLDASIPSRNFELTGQSPFLYYTKYNNLGLDRDLIKQQIKFTK